MVEYCTQLLWLLLRKKKKKKKVDNIEGAKELANLQREEMGDNENSI